MKITKVTPLVLGTEWRDLLFVKVETDEGLVGVGEARPVNRVDTVLGYLEETVQRYVLGSDPFAICRITLHEGSLAGLGGGFSPAVLALRISGLV